MTFRYLRCSPADVASLEALGHLPAPFRARLSETRPAARGARVLVVLCGDESGPIPIDRILNLRPYRRPKDVVAGGGLLLRTGPTGPRIALIFRRGVWDLPKGKQDRGESVEDCAVREVNEELGIDDARIVATAGTTVHGYVDGARYAVKTTYWYVMRTAAERFEPQAAEQIEAVEWVDLGRARSLLGYDGLRLLLDRAAPLLNGAA